MGAVYNAINIVVEGKYKNEIGFSISNKIILIINWKKRWPSQNLAVPNSIPI